jgi:hypothetical protein
MEGMGGGVNEWGRRWVGKRPVEQDKAVEGGKGRGRGRSSVY